MEDFITEDFITNDAVNQPAEPMKPNHRRDARLPSTAGEILEQANCLRFAEGGGFSPMKT